MLTQILEKLNLFLVIIIRNLSYLLDGFLQMTYFLSIHILWKICFLSLVTICQVMKETIYILGYYTFWKCSFSKWRLRLEYCWVLSLNTQGFYLLFQMQQKSLCLQHAQSSRMICLFKLLFAFIYGRKNVIYKKLW